MAQTVLAHGTGALNIDACRVAAPDAPDEAVYAPNAGSRYAGVLNGGQVSDAEPRATSATSAGRWPSNVVLSHVMTWDGADACGGPEGCVRGCPVAELDRQSGHRRPGERPATAGITRPKEGSGASLGGGWRGIERAHREVVDNGGGASRFFPTFRYQAKAPSAERPRVVVEDDGPEITHATVKPLELIRWLVRLVTPPDGVVLDPFAGSGTTAEACILEGKRCITVEQDAGHVALIRKRLAKDMQLGFDLGMVV